MENPQNLLDLHQRVRHFIIDERMKRFADLDRHLGELHDQLDALRNWNERRASEMRNELSESRNESERRLSELRNELEKKKDGSEYSGGLPKEEPRYEEGAGRRGHAHGNAQDGGG